MGQVVRRVGALVCAGVLGCAVFGCTSDGSGDSGDGGLTVMPTGGTAGLAPQAGNGAAGSAGQASMMTSGGAGATGAAGTNVSAGGRGGAGMGGSMAAAGSGGTAGAAGMPLPMAGMSGAAGTTATSDRSPEGTCTRWKMDRMNLSEGTWSGSTASCEVGDISAEGRANALRLLNLYRWLADLPPVETDPEFDRQAQACALLQRANNSLSHTPPASWMCYMAEGAEAAGRCNISTGPGVSSVAGYIVDPGNPTTIGHRRWILSNTFGPTGLGSTDRHSCMWTMGRNRLGRQWMAWPPPGPFPVQAMAGGFGANIDQTGWTVQSDMINLDAAQVTVMVDGAMQPVTVTKLLPGYGSRYAIRFNPNGWSTTAGKTYAISVTGISTPINYEVQMVNCN